MQFLTALTLLLILSGCGSSSNETTTPSPQAATITVAATVQCSYEDGPTTYSFKVVTYSDLSTDGFAMVTLTNDSSQSMMSTWDGKENKTLRFQGFDYTFSTSGGGLSYVTQGPLTYEFTADKCQVY